MDYPKSKKPPRTVSNLSPSSADGRADLITLYNYGNSVSPGG